MSNNHKTLEGILQEMYAPKTESLARAGIDKSEIGEIIHKIASKYIGDDVADESKVLHALEKAFTSGFYAGWEGHKSWRR